MYVEGYVKKEIQNDEFKQKTQNHIMTNDS